MPVRKYGRTSRVLQRQAYDNYFSPGVVGAHWMEFIEAHLPEQRQPSISSGARQSARGTRTGRR